MSAYLTRMRLLLLGAGACAYLIGFTLATDTLEFLHSFSNEGVRESLLWGETVLHLPLNAFL
jgi:hypothetical protein